MAIGFGAMLVVGLVLGFSLGPLTSGVAAQSMLDRAMPSKDADPSRVNIEEVSGEVWARSEGPGWRPLAAGDVLRRPATFRTVGLDGYVRLSVKGARLVIAQESVAHLGAAGTGLTFQVDEGLVLAYREKQPVRALVPTYEFEVSGQAYGIWVRPDQVNVAILEGKAEMRHRDAEPETFSFGREVTLRKGSLEPAVMPPTLNAEVISKRRSGSKSRIAARTWDNARVYSFGRDGFEEVKLKRGGTFTIRVPGDKPAPGTLIALDAAGRWAELEQPSRRLEQVLHDLKTGQRRRAREAPQTEVDDSKSRGSETRRSRRRSDDDQSSERRGRKERKERRERKPDAEGASEEKARRRRSDAPPPSEDPVDPPPVEDEEEDLERAL